MAYLANGQLYVRALDEFDARPLAAVGFTQLAPFFSPDGQWIGFFSLEEGALKKVAVSGGGAVTLTAASDPRGASWGEDDTIVFGENRQGISRVSGAGGAPEMLVSSDGAVGAVGAVGQPQLLPGGETLLFTLAEGQFSWDTAQIVVERLATGERTVLVEEGYDGRYLETGHLLYGFRDTPMAVPFDVERLEVTGGPVPLVEGVNRAAFRGAAILDVARNGTLVYQPFQAKAGARTLTWVGRDGTEENLPVPARFYLYARLSPDGTRVVLDARDEENDLWVWHLARETLTRLTFGAGYDAFPVWTPDGQRVVFASGSQRRWDEPLLAGGGRHGDTGTADRQPGSTGAFFDLPGWNAPGVLGAPSASGGRGRPADTHARRRAASGTIDGERVQGSQRRDLA